MTDNRDTPTGGSDPNGTQAEGQWPDEIDRAILDQLRDTYVLTDPPPAELDERVRFAIALENIDVEVARLQEDLLIGSGARGEDRTRTITFDCHSLTIMITIVDIGDDGVRLDGWLAPAARRQIELRVAEPSVDAAGSSRVVTTEDTGRFVFDHVGHGLVQLLVRSVEQTDDEPVPTVVTPSLLL
jgi:hypothetical protein